MADPVAGAVYTGAHVVDVSAMTGTLFDLPPKERSRLRSEQEGMPSVVAELAVAAPTVSQLKDLYQAFSDQTKTIAKIRAARADADKLAEVLAESEAKYVHERENTVSMIVDAVRSTAKRTGDTGMLALFEETIRYITQTARKAVETRKKAAAAKKAAGGSGGNGGG